MGRRRTKIIEYRINDQGYEVLTWPDRQGRAIKQHVVIAEKALGKRLPLKAIIHHVNEIRRDNRPANLVICPDSAYHSLIHRRINAKKACGNANWRKCNYCKEYDDPRNLHIIQGGKNGWHRECRNKYSKNWYHKKIKKGNKNDQRKNNP